MPLWPGAIDRSDGAPAAVLFTEYTPDGANQLTRTLAAGRQPSS